MRSAIEWIQLRTDLTLPCIHKEDGNNEISYNLKKNFSRFSLVRYGLVIDKDDMSACFYNLNEKIGHPLVIKYDPAEYIKPMEYYWEIISSLESEGKSDAKTLSQSLHWLLRSYEEESPIDNLIELFIAFEFLCSGVSVPKIVENNVLNRIKEYVEELKLDENQQERIIDCINMVNNPPIMVRWFNLLSNIGVNLTDEENDTISELRSFRNKLIHGESIINLSITKIEKFRSVLEKVFLYKTQGMKIN